MSDIDIIRYLQTRDISPDSATAFLEAAGNGCISGRVSEWPQLVPACAYAHNEIARLRRQLAVVREGLEWYANPENWKNLTTDPDGPTWTAMDNDEGDHARDTLAKLDQMKEKP